MIFVFFSTTVVSSDVKYCEEQIQNQWNELNVSGSDECQEASVALPSSSNHISSKTNS